MPDFNSSNGPFHDTNLAKHLREHRAKFPGLTDHEIARQLGYDRADLIAAIRNGHTKLPLNKAASLAQALGEDPVAMTRLALEQYGLRDDDATGMLFDRMATTNEHALLKVYRSAVDGSDFLLPRETLEDIKSLIANAYRRRRIVEKGGLTLVPG